MTDLTPGEPSEKSEIYKMLVLGVLLGSEVSSSCGKCGLDSTAKSRHFLVVQRFTYDVIGQ